MLGTGHRGVSPRQEREVAHFALTVYEGKFEKQCLAGPLFRPDHVLALSGTRRRSGWHAETSIRALAAGRLCSRGGAKLVRSDCQDVRELLVGMGLAASPCSLYTHNLTKVRSPGWAVPDSRPP